MFAIFANINSALEHPTLIHRNAPRLRSISERTFSTPHPPLLSSTGEGGRGVRVSCLKMLLFPAPQKFTTFNTFTAFATFAMFAMFAIFANFDPALDYPTQVHPQTPRARSVSERAVSRQNPPSPVSDGRGGKGGEGRSG